MTLRPAREALGSLVHWISVHLVVCCMGLAALAIPHSAQATLINLFAIDRGTYDSTGFHDSSNTNYVTGRDGEWLFRSFFLFDLSGIEGTILKAELHLFNPLDGFYSVEFSEVLEIYDVFTAPEELTAGGDGQRDIFNDLGEGVLFGSREVTHADNRSSIVTLLNEDFLDLANSSRGRLALGGNVSSDDDGYVFGFTNYEYTYLSLVTDAPVIPEPLSLAMLGVGSAMLFVRRKRSIPPH